MNCEHCSRVFARIGVNITNPPHPEDMGKKIAEMLRKFNDRKN